MKVKELIELLQKEDPERLVVMSKDGEGNGFEELDGIQACAYDTKYQETGLEDLTPELEEVGYTEEDVLTGNTIVKAVCLWP